LAKSPGIPLNIPFAYFSLILMDYGQVLHFSFSWRKRSLLFLKYAALVWVLFLGFALALLGIAYLLFKDLLLSLLSGTTGTIDAILLQPLLLGEMTITFFFTAVPLTVALCILCFYARLLMLSFALRRAEVESTGLDLMRFFILFFVALVWPLAALTSWFNKKMLLLPAAAIIFSLGTFVANDVVRNGGLALAVVLALAYAVVVIYNLARLSFALPIFLSKDESLVNAFEDSWKLTEQKIWSVILALFLVLLVVEIGFLIACIAISLTLAFLIYTQLALPSFFHALGIAAIIAALFLIPFKMLSFSFACIAIYKQLLGEKE